MWFLELTKHETGNLMIVNVEDIALAEVLQADTEGSVIHLKSGQTRLVTETLSELRTLMSLMSESHGPAHHVCDEDDDG